MKYEVREKNYISKKNNFVCELFRTRLPCCIDQLWIFDPYFIREAVQYTGSHESHMDSDVDACQSKNLIKM
jgi:hypothetical protein